MGTVDDSGRWRFHKRLGAGAFGVVELWRNEYTERLIAIKKCKGGSAQLSPKQRERWIKEVETMNALRHSNIVATRPIPDQLKELDGGVPILCMEYCSRGDLRTILNETANCCGIEEREALTIMRQVSSAVEYLHSQNLTHRDLKPENIVGQGTKERTIYKLTDLGYVRELGEMSADASVVGTMNYLAPELLIQPKYTCSVDYWSLGILFYELVTGARPFLPNMPITERWMKHVMRKRYEDICAWDEDGKVTFSAEIETPSTVSDCMRQPLTDWFRTALQWDPKRRGKISRSDGQLELVVFSMLKNILNWKLLRVFVVPQYKVETYAVQHSIKIGDLQIMIQQSTGIDVTHQTLTDCMGNVFIDADSMIQDRAEDSFLLVFQRDRLLAEDPPVLNIYPPLRRILDNPRNTVDNETSRRYYAAVYFFVKQEFDLFRFYVIALSIKIDLSSVELESVAETVQGLKARVDDLLNDITAYAQTNEYGLMSDELREALDTTSSKTQKLLEGALEVSSKLDALHVDFDELKKFSETNWLEQWTTLYDKAKTILEASAKGIRGQRCSTVNMVKVLYAALKLRDVQLHPQQPISSIVSTITNFDKSIRQLEESLNSFQALVNLYRNNYNEILERLATEAQTTCYALVESMTLSDSVIKDNIVLRRLVEEMYESYHSPFMDFEEL